MPKATLVIDTSVVIKWLSSDNEKDLDKADILLSDIQEGKVTVFVPELVKYEVGNVLLKSKHLSLKQAKVVLTEFFKIPLTFVSESIETANETFSVSTKLGITYYDATFLSLAKQYSTALVTENIKHQGKTREIKVIALSDY